MKTMYAITHLDADGNRALWYLNRAQYHFEAWIAANHALKAAIQNNPPHRLGKDMQVSTVECNDQDEVIRICSDVTPSNEVKPLTMPVCTECGSHKVRADALADYDVKAQDWVLSIAYPDEMDCADCEAPCKVKYIQVIACECNGTQELCEQCAGSGFKPVEVQS